MASYSAKRHAKKATGHYAHRPMKGTHQPNEDAFQKALAAAPDERSRHEVRRIREVIAAASKKKLSI